MFETHVATIDKDWGGHRFPPLFLLVLGRAIAQKCRIIDPPHSICQRNRDELPNGSPRLR
ncbi:MAG: hypothetical protein RID53_15660 [Coleofasciculus sp. B1-GNL1-01]